MRSTTEGQRTRPVQGLQQQSDPRADQVRNLCRKAQAVTGESLVKVTFETEREYRVETCRWYEAFIRAYVDVLGDLDVDHLVPLKNTHLSRGWRWDLPRRTKYARTHER